jgi:hypothetical protein
VKRALLIAAISVWSVLGPAAAGATDNAIVGYWYGRGYQPTLGRDNEFIDHHAPDGKFEVHFRAYEGCKVVEDQSEAGTWAMLDADTVRVTTTSVDGIPAGPYIDDYRTEELTAQFYRYVWIQKGVTYTSQRVDANFKFPDCGLTS